MFSGQTQEEMENKAMYLSTCEERENGSMYEEAYDGHNLSKLNLCDEGKNHFNTRNENGLYCKEKKRKERWLV